MLEAKETYDDAKRTLAALLWLPLDEAETFKIRGSLHGLDLPPPPVEILIRRGLETRPDLAAFRLGILRARSEVRLARANRLDDVFLLYQPFSSQQGLNPGERSATSWAVGLTVPLPVYNRNQGNIARAAETVLQTEVQLANLERQVILEIQRAEAAYEVTLTTIKRIEAEILPAARENLEISLRQSRRKSPTRSPSSRHSEPSATSRASISRPSSGTDAPCFDSTPPSAAESFPEGPHCPARRKPPGTRRRSAGDEAVADRVLDELGRALHAQGFHEAGLVEFGRAPRDVQGGRDFLGRTTLADQLEDFTLAGVSSSGRAVPARTPAGERPGRRSPPGG